MMNCPICNGKTLVYDEDWEDFHWDPARGTYDITPISLMEDNEIWHVCLKCDCWQLECSDCKNLCRFIGYSGMDKNSSHLRIPSINVVDEEYNKEIKEQTFSEKDNLEDADFCLRNGGVVLHHYFTGTEEVKIEILNEESTRRCFEDFPEHKDFPYHYVGDKDQFYAIDKPGFGYCLTGPDGGFPHYWKCDTCQKSYSFTDK